MRFVFVNALRDFMTSAFPPELSLPNLPVETTTRIKCVCRETTLTTLQATQFSHDVSVPGNYPVRKDTEIPQLPPQPKSQTSSGGFPLIPPHPHALQISGLSETCLGGTDGS